MQPLHIKVNKAQEENKAKVVGVYAPFTRLAGIKLTRYIILFFCVQASNLGVPFYLNYLPILPSYSVIVHWSNFNAILESMLW